MTSKSPNKTKKYLLIFIKATLVFAIIYYLVHSDKLDLSKLSLLYLNPGLTLTVFLCIFLGMNLVATYRWQLLMEAQGQKIPLKTLFNIIWVGQFFSTVLPGTFSLDGVKAYYVIKETRNRATKTQCLTALIVERISGMAAMLTLSATGLLWYFDVAMQVPGIKILGIFVFAVLAGILVFFGLIFFPFDHQNDPLVRLLLRLPLNSVTTRIYQAFRQYRLHKKALVMGLLISLLVQASLIFLFFLIAQVLCKGSMPVSAYLFTVPIGELSTIVPLGPGGIGVGHLAYDYLFGAMGMQGGADAFNHFTIIRLLVGLFGGIPYLLFLQLGVRFQADEPGIETPNA